MSNALAIAGVSAVVRDLLNNGFIDHQVTDAMGQGVMVTAVAPDLVPTTGADVRPRLNVFLYQVGFNAALRNDDLPSRNARGERTTNPTLALDLHYLITAYGVLDLQAEVLLAYAMQLLHETPVLTREAIRTALAPPGVDGALLPTIYQALRASTLADQIETLKITPATVNTDELSRLWTAVQMHYRPSMPYQVSVVLIDSERPARAPLPVLTRGPRDPLSGLERGIVAQPELESPFPDILRVVPPNRQTAARLGETVEVLGTRLDGVNRTVSLTHPRFNFTRAIPAAAGQASDRLSFVVPNDPANLPAGTYLLSVHVQRPGEAQPREAGPLLLALAPRITTALPFSVLRDAQGAASITLTFEPNVRPQQRVSLLLGTRDVPVRLAAPTDTATFDVPEAAPGTVYARLRVDGVESILVDRTASPPAFRNDRITVI